MKIEIFTRSDEEVENCDDRNAYQIKIDGEEVFCVSDGEPEDSNLSRDFNDTYKIAGLLMRAYAAGKEGDTLKIIELESDEI